MSQLSPAEPGLRDAGHAAFVAYTVARRKPSRSQLPDSVIRDEAAAAKALLHRDAAKV